MKTTLFGVDGRCFFLFQFQINEKFDFELSAIKLCFFCTLFMVNGLLNLYSAEKVCWLKGFFMQGFAMLCMCGVERGGCN